MVAMEFDYFIAYWGKCLLRDMGYLAASFIT